MCLIEQDHPVHDAISHMQNVGRMVNNNYELHDIHFINTRDVANLSSLTVKLFPSRKWDWPDQFLLLVLVLPVRHKI